MSWILALRWLHVITAMAWIGQVLVIVFVLVPIVDREREGKVQLDLLQRIFPPLFRLASVLSGLAIVAGGLLLWHRIAEAGGEFFSAWQNHALLTGAILAIVVLGLDHATGPRLRRTLDASADDDGPRAAAALRTLRQVSWSALVVLTLAAVLMMIGVRGV